MLRRTIRGISALLLLAALGFLTTSGISATALLAETPTLSDKCESGPITARFVEFGKTGKMPPDLRQFLGNPAAQNIEPYQAFDNVYYVGICWVSAWLITSPNGHVLIDTLYGPYTDRLLANISALGLDPQDIRLVVVTHGHFDHAGGLVRLKEVLVPGTRFAMTAGGWAEALEDSAAKRPFPWPMIQPDMVLVDGQTMTGGDVAIQAFETPGHTMGTGSYAYDVRDGDRTYRAFTVGGLGLNAIRGPEQVEAYIASVERIRQLTEAAGDPIQLHLTTHGFSTGLPEASAGLKNRSAGAPHPLVDLDGFRKQLDALQGRAESRLAIEQNKKDQ